MRRIRAKKTARPDAARAVWSNGLMTGFGFARLFRLFQLRSFRTLDRSFRILGEIRYLAVFLLDEPFDVFLVDSRRFVIAFALHAWVRRFVAFHRRDLLSLPERQRKKGCAGFHHRAQQSYALSSGNHKKTPALLKLPPLNLRR